MIDTVQSICLLIVMIPLGLIAVMLMIFVGYRLATLIIDDINDRKQNKKSQLNKRISDEIFGGTDE